MAEERWTITNITTPDLRVQKVVGPEANEVEAVPLAALSACQEELARLGGAYREVVEWWRAAEAARDELARAIERRYDGPGTADEAVAAALEAFYGKVSSEATKGDE